MSEWRKCALGDVVELKRGYDLPTRLRVPGPYPIISSSGVSGCHEEPRAKGPGVVTGRYGTLGKVFYVEEDFWPLNTALYVKDFKGNNPKFIGYFLQLIDFFSFSDKAAVPGINRNHLHQALVEVPDVQTQRRIAHILGTLDDKIELNRRMNRALEAIARAIFKSWFVDFDPVHAKAEGREPVGMDPETAVLFPDCFQESSLGKIPKGWEVSSLDGLLELSRKSIKPQEHPTEEFDHFSIPAYDAGSPALELGVAIRSSKHEVLPSAVLISKLNPHIPRVWLPHVSEDRRPICSTEFLVCVPREGVPREYIYCLLSSVTFLDVFAQMVTGTTGSHQRVRPTAFVAMEVVQPPPELLTAFGKITQPPLSNCARQASESSKLAAIRDALLPKLISGKLEVMDAGKSVEEGGL